MVTQRKHVAESAPKSHDEVLHAVRRRIDGCHHGFIFRKVKVEFQHGQLILHGKVPSFYLKQNLQELLREIPNVERIVNNVDVVSSTGLSSVRRQAEYR